MSCSINSDAKMHKWVIPKGITRNILPNLYLDKEVSGLLNLHDEKKIITDFTLSEGQKDSVDVPLAIVNYHTHPISCYISEKTIWGWPSGEDIRECVLFGIKGCIAHAVFAVEGTYIIQINPCVLENLCNLESVIDLNKIENGFWKLFSKKHSFGKINKKTSKRRISKKTSKRRISKKTSKRRISKKTSKKISFFNFGKKKSNKKLSKSPSKGPSTSEKYDIIRGIIVLIIEIYFRSTHAFRTYDFNKNHNKVSPKDYLNFCNVFEFKNIFENNEIKGCSDINCDSVWTFEDSKHKKTSLKKYISDYEDDSEIYKVNKKGEAIFTNVKIGKVFKFDSFINILKNLTLGNSCKYPKDLWNNHWIMTTLTENTMTDSNKKYMDKSCTSDDLWKFLNNSVKRPNSIKESNEDNHFYFFEMFGSCSPKDIHKNISEPHKYDKCSNDLIDKNYDINVEEESHEFGSKKESLKNKDLLLIGSPNCNYCVKLKEFLEKNEIKFELDYHNEIKDAVKKASEVLKESVYTIPQLIDKKTNKKIEHEGFI